MFRFVFLSQILPSQLFDNSVPHSRPTKNVGVSTWVIEASSAFSLLLFCLRRPLSLSMLKNGMLTPPHFDSRVGYARLQRGSNPSVTDSEIQLMKVVVPFANATSTTSPYRLSLPAVTSSSDIEELSEVVESASDTATAPPSNFTSLPPIPLSSYASHLTLTPAPYPPLSSDPTVWTPERYLPPSLLFPSSKFSNEGTRGHFFIVLNGQMGSPGQNAFMDAGEKEVRRLREVEELERMKEGEGCPIM